MSMRTYPAFCSLNQSEPEPSPELEHTTASLPLDQAPQDELLVTRLLDQFRALIEQYKTLESPPAIHVPPDFQQAITVEDSPPPTRELTGPVRSRQSPPRTPHACDNCRTSKSKVRSYRHIFLRSLTIEFSALARSQCVRAAKERERPARGLL
jgi:hypothetical protein